MILKNSVVVWEPNGIFKINRNKHVSGFSNILTFAPKSAWKTSIGYPNLDVFFKSGCI